MPPPKSDTFNRGSMRFTKDQDLNMNLIDLLTEIVLCHWDRQCNVIGTGVTKPSQVHVFSDRKYMHQCIFQEYHIVH